MSLPQIFGVVESDPLTVLAHDRKSLPAGLIVGAEGFADLANGEEFSNRYRHKDRIVYYYLKHTVVRPASDHSVLAEECPSEACNAIIAR